MNYKYEIVELAPVSGKAAFIIKMPGGFFGPDTIIEKQSMKQFYFGDQRPKLFYSIEKATDYIKNIHLKDIVITHTKEIGVLK
jgi:hypothetical protein